MLNRCTNDYECLVLDNTSNSNRPEDCIFYYKAQPRGDFKAGSEAYWAWHYVHYDPALEQEHEQEDDDDEYLSQQMVRRPRNIRVRKV